MNINVFLDGLFPTCFQTLNSQVCYWLPVIFTIKNLPIGPPKDFKSP